jgi:hypothetical protein
MKLACDCLSDEDHGENEVVRCLIRQREMWQREADRVRHHEVLRDRFAMAALTTLPECMDMRRREGRKDADLIATAAYELADAMLTARERKP